MGAIRLGEAGDIVAVTREKLLEYVKFDTASDAGSPTVPSTMKQKDLGEYLVKEMQAMGIKDAEMDENGYVYGSIPATPGYEKAPRSAFWPYGHRGRCAGL